MGNATANASANATANATGIVTAAGGEGGGGGGGAAELNAGVSWDGPAVGSIKWLYSDARQEYERRVADSLSELLSVPRRRVVIQGTQVEAAYNRTLIHIWVPNLSDELQPWL